MVSGSALLVDYVLTITTSLAAAGDALFSFLPPAWAGSRLTVEVALVLGLTAPGDVAIRREGLAPPAEGPPGACPKPGDRRRPRN